MADDPYVEFRDELIDAGLLLPTGVEGLYGRSATYQNVVDAFCRIIPQVGGDQHFEPVHFPPVLARSVFDQTDYLRSFPDLMGSVHVFHGDDRKHAQLLREVEKDGDWAGLLDPADVVLCSATCHPVYPLCTGRPLPAEGRRFEIHGFCFRHEPSPDPARMQAFHMHELVWLTATRASSAGWSCSATSASRWTRCPPTTPSSVGWARCSRPTSSRTR